MSAQSYPQRAFAVPPDAIEIVIVRHGASAAAVPDEPFPLLGGHSDPPLSEEGERQAAAVAERLADEPLQAVFVTPLRRTAETAAPLAAARGLEPVVLEDLREVHLGEWEGGEYRIRIAKRDPIAYRALREERWDVIPGAESSEDLAHRVGRGLETMLETVGPGGRAAAFLHGGVIGELCRQVTGSRPFAFIHSDNASISRLVVLANGYRLLRTFNDTAHLDGAAPGGPPDPANRPTAISVRLNETLLGDLGNPRVDGRLLLAIALRGGRASAWLRDRGLDDVALRRLIDEL